jgi:PIN domain nuclease of toxin-antitoxin system
MTSSIVAEHRFLLDTQILIWSAIDPSKFNTMVSGILGRPESNLLVSSVTIAEMEIKIVLGKLSLPGSPIELCEQLGASELELTWKHASGLASLQPIHKDPFDRLLIAQAIAEDIPLITSDGHILLYPEVSSLKISRIQRGGMRAPMVERYVAADGHGKPGRLVLRTT